MRTDSNASLDARAPSAPLRVLLVEEHPIYQRLALEMLKLRGAVVTVAENGRDAIEAWAISRFDIIVINEADAIDAALIIRSREETAEHVPIVAFVAEAAAGHRERFADAGIDACISMPPRAAELLTAVDRLVGGQLELSNC
jgi:CheY-like chemotaxis protein